jgi:serine/threonine protein kinase
LIIQHDEGYVRAYNNLGYIYRSIGKYEHALRIWNEGLKFDPSYERLQKNISRLQRRLESKKKSSGAIGIEDFISDIEWLSANAEFSEIREGRFFDTYIIEDNGASVAIKTPRAILARDVQSLKAFEKCCRPWLDLGRCKYILHAKSIKWVRGRPCLVMEYSPEGSLQDFFNRPPGLAFAEDVPEDSWSRVSLAQVLEFAIQLCIGVHFSHTHIGVAHGDIRLENLLLCRTVRENAGVEGRQPEYYSLNIADVGLWPFFQREADLCSAKGDVLPELAGEGLVKTLSGYLTPSLLHCAPELLDSSCTPDAASDIFSFGVTFYEMLTGMLPFSGSNAAESLKNIRKAPPDTPSSINNCIPPAIDAVVVRCLEQEPQDRFKNFFELAKELLECMRAVSLALERLSVLCKRYKKISRFQFFDEQTNESVMIVGGMESSSEIGQCWEILRRQAERDGDSERLRLIVDIEKSLVPQGTSMGDIYPTPSSIIDAMPMIPPEKYHEELLASVDGKSTATPDS